MQKSKSCPKMGRSMRNRSARKYDKQRRRTEENKRAKWEKHQAANPWDIQFRESLAERKIRSLDREMITKGGGSLPGFLRRY